VRRDRDKNNAQYFYIGSLKSELHPIGQGNLSLTFAISKDLQSLQHYTFKICKNTTQ